MRALLVVLLLFLGPYSYAADVKAPQNSTIPNYCRTSLSRSDALDWPSKHAWNLFVVLNHPALDKRFGRGRPDCSKPIGTPGTTSVWETWRNARTEVYLSDGSEPPAWDDTSLPDESPGEVPKMMKAKARFADGAVSFHETTGILKPRFSDDGVFRGTGGLGETRMNRATYEFVRRECLFSKQGQQRYAQAIVSGKKPPISFPPDSIEAKAVWLDFERENISTAKQKTYYTAINNGKKYGLVALHVITKETPNWFWATFHHADAPDNDFETEDTHGRPAELRGTVWEHYELGGTQIDFVTPSGAPTILSDHYIEYQFQRSSCISCHSTASISPEGPPLIGQPLALCSLTPNIPDIGLDIATCKRLLGQDAFIPGTDKLVVERGPPNPAWFEKTGKAFFYQTDFVFSIPFRAQDEKKDPPARCIW